MKAWIEAFRLRTLPLSLASIGMGSFLAAAAGKFNGGIFALCCLTTVLLQVLSNLANDYGDSIHGADHAGRKGPLRAVQSGAITSAQMKSAIILFVVLCLCSGLTLIWLAFGLNWNALLFFFSLGLLSILAAITYTAGRKPYGYMGLGDLSVLIFFGLVGVLGSCYLFTREVNPLQALPALSCGFFAMGVLNINNIRDIESDKAAGKFSIPVRIGKASATRYHWLLLLGGITAAAVYTVMQYQSPWQWLFVVSVPLLIRNGVAVQQKSSAELDPFLKQMALSTLLFVITFGIGLLMH